MIDLNEKDLECVIKETNFSGLGERKSGKVRDIYTREKDIILVATDRHSSFDRIIAHIPYKGQILNQISAFWFDQTKDIVPNHVLAVPDPNVVVGKKCQMLPIEMVVRGYITGVTGTSLWTLYQNGQRDFGSFVLPEGMKKNQQLVQPVLTPSTKFEEHDRTLTPDQVVTEGLVEKKVWDELADRALALFAHGQEVAAAAGLILVDTKYEFGLDDNGQVTLIDEVHTPDSSRYWQAASFKERFEANEEPEYFDKEFLRLWFRDHCDPYKDEVLPAAPAELVLELSRRYIQIYEQITGLAFVPEQGAPAELVTRIEKNIKSYVGA